MALETLILSHILPPFILLAFLILGLVLVLRGLDLFRFYVILWGIFIGAFSGGIAGEILEGRKGKEAIKIGWAIFIGNMVSVGIKLSFSLLVIFFYMKAAIVGW